MYSEHRTASFAVLMTSWAFAGCLAATEADGALSEPDAGALAWLEGELASVRYEAEDRATQSSCREMSNYPGFTGRGFMDFGGDGSWMVWRQVRAPLAGIYRLDLRYANGSGAARPSTVVVNGVRVAWPTFASTGRWRTWRVESVTVRLAQGDNIVRVRALSESGGPNLDHMVVTPVDLCPDDARKVLPGACGCGQPEGRCDDQPGGPISQPEGSIALPIEVFGPSGTTREVAFDLPDPAGVTHLYVRCNACGYHDVALDGDPAWVKASVRVNGGPAVPFKHFTGRGQLVGNPALRVLGGEAKYGGIGGGFRTVRFTVPVEGLVRGRNTLTFEHVRAAPPSMGFRVIELNLLRAGRLESPVLPPEAFVEDEPSRWRPPHADPADVERGRRLWVANNRLYDPGLDGLDGVLGGRGAVDGALAASCADCHARDGRDLKYFNYSNLSIIERAKFHGMTQREGELIASYIRTRDIPVVPQARPWNPAYQPGPGMDDRPVYEWAAGAGVDAILDDDAQMAAQLFPQGTELPAVRAVVNRNGTLNMRELAVSIPMPEWNQWLPLVHPDDAFNTGARAVRSDPQGRGVGRPYYQALYEAARANPNRETLGDMTEEIKRWLRQGLTCQSNGPKNGEPWRALNGDVLAALALPSPNITRANCDSQRDHSALAGIELAKRGLAAWISVKQWEIVHGNALEEASQRVSAADCPSRPCRVAPEARGWFVNGRNVFDRTPHFLGDDKRYLQQNLTLGLLESNSWYHLTMILNPGYRVIMPSHFVYTLGHLGELEEASGQGQSWRFWATVIKMRQLQTSGRYGVEAGLDLRTAQPYLYYSDRRGETATRAGVGRPLWRRLVQALIVDFVADANNATAQDWARANQNRVVQPRNSTDFSTCDRCFESTRRPEPFQDGAFQGRNTFRVLPKLRALGVSEDRLQQLINWCQKTWPRGPWRSVR